MTPATTTMPSGTIARILLQVASEPHPKLILGTIAANHHVTMDVLKSILDRNGYPDPEKMRANAHRLEEATHEHQAAPAPDNDDTGSTAGELGTLLRVPVMKIYPDPANLREELHGIEELADSISEAGLLQPVLLRRAGARLLLVAGHRRLAAVKLLKWTDVPAIIRNEMRPDDVVAAMLIENGQRQDLDPIEEARGMQRLKTAHDLSDLEVAQKIGRSQPYVSNRLALLNLTPAQQAEIRAGTMNMTEASHHGRLNAGKVRPPGHDAGWHLGPAHDLADRVKARCLRLGHKRGRTVGSMGCGECWETLIRTDERNKLQKASNELNRCVLCDTQHTDAQAAQA